MPGGTAFIMKSSRNIMLFFFIFIACTPFWTHARVKTFFVENLCLKEYDKVNIDLSREKSGILMSTPGSYGYKSFECEITFLTYKESSIVLSIYNYDIKPGDTLTIRDSDWHTIGLIGKATFQDERKTISTGSMLVVTFKKNSSTHAPISSTFQFTVTEANQYLSGECYGDEFRCKNYKCILKTLTCDGHNHCGDNSDQSNCSPQDPNYVGYKGNLNVYQKHGQLFMYLGIVAAAALIVVTISFSIVMIINRKSKKAENSQRSPENGAITMQPVPETAIHNQPQPLNNSNNLLQQPTVEDQNGAFYNRICNSFRSKRNTKVEEYPTRQENIQVPSMYPNLNPTPSAPQHHGEDNPNFNSNE